MDEYAEAVMGTKTLYFAKRHLHGIGTYTKGSMYMKSVEDSVKQVIYGIRAELLCQRVANRTVEKRVPVPANWWQHLRQSHFPAWWLKRFPVKITHIVVSVVYEIEATYPEADLMIHPKEMGRVHMAAYPVVEDDE